MAKRKIFSTLLATLLFALVAILVSCIHPPAITGQAIATDLGHAASAKIQREGAFLSIDLSYFPSFESTFDEPQVLQEGENIVVLLRSYRPGFVHRKSEQKTNLSFKISAGEIPGGSRLQFLSEDYDQVFAVGIAP